MNPLLHFIQMNSSTERLQKKQPKKPQVPVCTISSCQQIFTDHSCVKMTTQCPKLTELGGPRKSNLSPGSIGLPLQGKQAPAAESLLTGGLAPSLIQPDNLSVCTSLKLCKCQSWYLCQSVSSLHNPTRNLGGNFL